MKLEYETYEEAEKNFTWDERWEVFEGTRERFNIVHECIDRHPKGDTAIRIKFDDHRSETYTFGEFSRLTSQFAFFLEENGIEFGDRVALLLAPSIEFYVGMFGTFRRGAVVVPCSPLFGPDAIAFRILKSEAKAVVTTREMASLINEEAGKDLAVIYADDLVEKIGKMKEHYEPTTKAKDLAMIQFSSGTTGAPKSILYRHGAITVAAPVVKFGIGLKDDDNYFCPSSPAWGHGIWYGTIGPLIFGRALGTYSGKFDAETFLEALQDFEVTNVSAIPSHFRLVLKSGKLKDYKLKLRTFSYTGEAMPLDLFDFVKDEIGVVPHCIYGTTEAGPIALNYAGFKDWKVKPGSLGKPMIGGKEASIIDDDGNVLPTGEEGQIALKDDKGGWVRIGDSAYKDEDGYFWYKARADDVIISAGYTIGPIEIEEALLKHPAVEEAGVIGSPDKDRGQIVKAFVSINCEPSEKLKEEIKEFVKTRLSKHEYPKEIEFIDEIPKTPDGKIKRKVLKALEVERKGG
ncbi:MAG: AMP-binding protein [Thermodesulfobacteriota bacterium]|nr:AMP-binding protein [Thermodesulfobacteriota bacterium]